MSLVFENRSPCEYKYENEVFGFEVELQGAQGDREAEFFQVSNIDTAVAQRRLEDKQPEEKTNTDCLRSTTPNVRKSGLICPRNMGFNDSELKYKEKFSYGSGVGTGSMQVLHGFEFKVEQLGSYNYELARDREQHLACGLFGYREDSNEAAFAVAAVEKIYAHESLTFNDTVACEDDSDAITVESTPDVGMLDKFDRGLQTDVQVFVDFDYAMGRSITRSREGEFSIEMRSTKLRQELYFSATKFILRQQISVADLAEIRLVTQKRPNGQGSPLPLRSISLSDEEIALDASSEGTISPGGPRYDYMLSSEAEDDY
ncbi:hypothetical protein Tco_0754868 [Tanacetum coccineum]